MKIFMVFPSESPTFLRKLYNIKKHKSSSSDEILRKENDKPIWKIFGDHKCNYNQGTGSDPAVTIQLISPYG